MAETRIHPPADENTDPRPGRGATTGTSRGQKVAGIMGLVVVLWVGNNLFETITGAGGRPGGQRPPSDASDSGGDAGHTPPPGTPRH